MRILFEEYHYETEVLSHLIEKRYYFPINQVYSKINFVGYYFNPLIDNKGDSVIIFPKVFINKEGKVFNNFEPNDLINPSKEIIHQLKFEGKFNFVFEISTWLYRAIQQYNIRRKNNIISENQETNQVVSNLDEKASTELDIILSLLKFYKENQNLFTFISKTSHSQQHKINWQKTINKSIPILQNGKPFYVDFKTKNKRINDDEELLILFYSVLNYVNDKYSFGFRLNEHYDFIKGHQFEKLLNNGCQYLKKIKYKYYSDKMLSLYQLLYTFFERSNQIQSKKKLNEVLLIKDFNIVFEDMIDDLIGDNNLFPKLKNHEDGKQLDHIYKYQSLIMEDDIYFVGDSKYYKTDSSVGVLSKAKQFTYAKNVIQQNIKLFNEDNLPKGIRYRDSLTEGYNITPNFFISAFVTDDFDFKKSKLEKNGNPIMQYHFENRLFDRDTLFVHSYNINFLFVLSTYISNNSNLKLSFKKNTQLQFRNNLILYLNEQYSFYKIKPKKGIELFVEKYFRKLNGKMYQPSSLNDELIIALKKNPKSSDFNLNVFESEGDIEIIQLK